MSDVLEYGPYRIEKLDDGSYKCSINVGGPDAGFKLEINPDGTQRVSVQAPNFAIGTDPEAQPFTVDETGRVPLEQIEGVLEPDTDKPKIKHETHKTLLIVTENGDVVTVDAHAAVIKRKGRGPYLDLWLTAIERKR